MTFTTYTTIIARGAKHFLDGSKLQQGIETSAPEPPPTADFITKMTKSQKTLKDTLQALDAESWPFASSGFEYRLSA